MNPGKKKPASPTFKAVFGRFPALACAAALMAGCHRDKPAAEMDEAARTPQAVYDTLSSRIKMGESFNSIVHGLKLQDGESSRLLAGIKKHFAFKLYAGQSYKVIFRVTDTSRVLESFVLEDRYSERLHVLSRSAAAAATAAENAGTVASVSGTALRTASAPPLPGQPPASVPALAADPAGFAYAIQDIPVHVDTVAVNGVLRSNLYDAFVAKGETGALIQQVTKIFAWDLDFFKDPRAGDEFSLLVEKKSGEDGAFRGYGELLSAKYVNRGHEFVGILYKGSYFDQDGHSLEKMLMKAPLNFVRVSSGFSSSRLHPILGVRRPHWGIDYAGPKGTKILAAGDGVVVYSRWVNGYGKTIKIRHNGVYNTYYAHLNGYASGIGAGKRVKQGDVIGYMGMTGLATGVHLDYRVEYNGKYINPASLKMEAKAGVDKPEWKDFCDQRDFLLARMSTPALEHFARVSAPSSESDTKAF